VVIEKNGKPFSTKDGATASRNIELVDPFENEGASLVKVACIKTGESAGDGSTTSMVLAEALLVRSLKFIIAGINTDEFLSGLKTGVDKMLQVLDEVADKNVSSQMVSKVATVAANNDSNAGELIEKLLANNRLLPAIFEDSQGVENELEIIHGTEIQVGFYSRDFITNIDKQSCELEDTFILVVDQKIEKFHELLPVLVIVAGYSKPITIIAKDFSSDVISTLAANKRNKTLDALAIKVPESYGSEFFEDIALVCGAELVCPQKGNSLEKSNLNSLGRVKSIVSTSERTIIYASDNKSEQLNLVIDSLTAKAVKETDINKKNSIVERLSRLTGKIAHVYIGAPTGFEREEKKNRFINAYYSAKAALDEGIVPGGGTAFLYALQKLDGIENLSAHEQIAIQVLKESLKAPFRTIIENGGEQSPGKFERIMEENKLGYGYNIVTGKYEDFFLSGIVDPVKSLKEGLSNAVSVVSLLVRTKCVITENKA